MDGAWVVREPVDAAEVGRLYRLFVRAPPARLLLRAALPRRPRLRREDRRRRLMVAPLAGDRAARRARRRAERPRPRPRPNADRQRMGIRQDYRVLSARGAVPS